MSSSNDEKNEICLQPYLWEKENVEDEGLIVRIWCVDRSNNIHLCVIKDFSPWVFIELPERIGVQDVTWSQDGVEAIEAYIRKKMPAHLAPVRMILMNLKPLSRYRPPENETVQYILCMFRHTDGINLLRNALSGDDFEALRPVNIPGLGILKLPVWEG